MSRQRAIAVRGMSPAAVNSKPKTIALPGADYSIRVVGAQTSLLRDVYHALLHWRWHTTVAFIAAVFV